MRSIQTAAVCFCLFLGMAFLHAENRTPIQTDDLSNATEKLKFSFYGHGSLGIEFNELQIYVDPVSMFIKQTDLPKSDIILITHEHRDHLDSALIQKLSKNTTEIITNENCSKILKTGTVMENGQELKRDTIAIEAVPAYNLTKGREQFHPRGRDNGFILSLGSKRIYIAGDTEDIPEMENFKNIDIAFLPVNQPYTMNMEQLLHAVDMIAPKIVYPYHRGDTDVSLLEQKLKTNNHTEVRIRNLQ